MKKRIFYLMLVIPFILGAESGSVLQSGINLATESTNQRNIPPGSLITITASVENSGDRESVGGKFYVRFILPEQIRLRHEAKPLFETEKVALKPLKPDETLIVTFDTRHQLPPLLDFIRHDYPMHHYEALLEVDGREYMLGTASLCVSAHYYEGPSQEIPVSGIEDCGKCRVGEPKIFSRPRKIKP